MKSVRASSILRSQPPRPWSQSASNREFCWRSYLSLLRHVRHSYRPHTTASRAGPAGRWEPIAATAGNADRAGTDRLSLRRGSFYANENRFCGRVRASVEHAPNPVRWFILDARRDYDIDRYFGRSPSAIFSASSSTRDVNVIFARVKCFLRSDLDRMALQRRSGEARIEYVHEAIDAVQGGGTLKRTPIAFIRRARGQRAAPRPPPRIKESSETYFFSFFSSCCAAWYFRLISARSTVQPGRTCEKIVHCVDGDLRNCQIAEPLRCPCRSAP